MFRLDEFVLPDDLDRVLCALVGQFGQVNFSEGALADLKHDLKVFKSDGPSVASLAFEERRAPHVLSELVEHV